MPDWARPKPESSRDGSPATHPAVAAAHMRRGRAGLADPGLSAADFAASAALLPLPADLLGLCAGGPSHHGPIKGLWLARTAHRALPSHLLARRFVGLRSRSARQIEFKKTSMNENRNLILAIALSAAVLFGWQYFVAGPQMKSEQAAQAAKTTQTARPAMPARRPRPAHRPPRPAPRRRRRPRWPPPATR